MREITQKEKGWFKELDLDYKRCTCLTCTLNEKCQYAFDPYNTNGDCLEEK